MIDRATKPRIDPDYLLVLRPEPSRPDGPDLYQRLRSALKGLLRQHGLRCIRIAPDLSPDSKPPDPPDAAPTEPAA